MKRPTLAQVHASAPWLPVPEWPLTLPGVWVKAPKERRPPVGWFWSAKTIDGVPMVRIDGRKVER